MHRPKHNITTQFIRTLEVLKKTYRTILINGKAICVIEIKDTNTKDLKSLSQQNFDYKSNHPKCDYIMTSNFEKHLKIK